MAAHNKFEQLERFRRDVESCIECGSCTIWCPIYQAKPLESSVARGKNKMIRALLNGDAGYTEEVADMLATCTLCLACTAHCPVKSEAPSTIIAARADQARSRGISFPSNLIYRWLVPHRTLLGKALKLGSWLQRNVVPQIQSKHMPLFASANGNSRQIPPIGPRSLKQMIPDINKPPAGIDTKLRIGYFIGCMTDLVFPELGKKVIGVLTRHGVEVVTPKEQGCCGSPLFLGAGDFETGRKMADANAKLFENVDYIVSDCATCSWALKDYAKYLADTPERRESYTRFGDKVKDVSQFLVEVLKLPPKAYQPVPEIRGKKITWHDPCHLARHLGVTEQPRQIMKSLPNVEYIEMARADFCCGMGGAFGISHYDLSKKIGDKAAETIKATEADIVVTGCPGCMIQLMDTCERHKMPQKVVHIMEIME